MATAQAVTDKDFEERVLHSEEPVLVDFWATWCGPCRMIAPVVEELADEYAGKLSVLKLDVDANPATALEYDIRSIPTLLLFKEGKVHDHAIGVAPKAVLKKKIDRVLGVQESAPSMPWFQRLRR